MQLTLKKHSITPLSDQIFQVRLQPESGSIFDFKGGQYLYLLMPDGKKIPLSIASPPQEKRFIEIHIRLIPGHPLAQAMLDLFDTADHVHVEGPCGQCYLLDGNRSVVIIAGGTGFSPMKSLLESAIAKKDEREFYLFVGAQTSAEIYQTDIINSWPLDNFNLNYQPVVNQPDNSWQGKVGFPHEVALEVLGEKASQCDFFISGSEAMVVNVYQSLLAKGISKQAIYSDILDIKREMDEDF